MLYASPQNEIIKFININFCILIENFDFCQLKNIFSNIYVYILTPYDHVFMFSVKSLILDDKLETIFKSLYQIKITVLDKENFKCT